MVSKSSITPLIILDTNVVLRFLLKDNKALTAKATRVFMEAEQGRYFIYLDDLVIAETAWVLKSVYYYTGSQISKQLLNLIERDFILLNDKELVKQALICFDQKNLAYIDCWLKTLAENQNLKLVTFDKKLAKSHLT